MLRIEPSNLPFGNVTPKTPTTNYVHITNTTVAPLDLALTNSAPNRYELTPTALRLQHNEAATVKLTLRIDNPPPTNKSRHSETKDSFVVRSQLGVQRFTASFTCVESAPSACADDATSAPPGATPQASQPATVSRRSRPHLATTLQAVPEETEIHVNPSPRRADGAALGPQPETTLLPAPVAAEPSVPEPTACLPRAASLPSQPSELRELVSAMREQASRPGPSEEDGVVQALKAKHLSLETLLRDASQLRVETARAVAVAEAASDYRSPAFLAPAVPSSPQDADPPRARPLEEPREASSGKFIAAATLPVAPVENEAAAPLASQLATLAAQREAAPAESHGATSAAHRAGGANHQALRRMRTLERRLEQAQAACEEARAKASAATEERDRALASSETAKQREGEALTSAASARADAQKLSERCAHAEVRVAQLGVQMDALRSDALVAQDDAAERMAEMERAHASQLEQAQDALQQLSTRVSSTKLAESSALSELREVQVKLAARTSPAAQASSGTPGQLNPSRARRRILVQDSVTTAGGAPDKAMDALVVEAAALREQLRAALCDAAAARRAADDQRAAYDVRLDESERRLYMQRRQVEAKVQLLEEQVRLLASKSDAHAELAALGERLREARQAESSASAMLGDAQEALRESSAREASLRAQLDAAEQRCARVACTADGAAREATEGLVLRQRSEIDQLRAQIEQASSPIKTSAGEGDDASAASTTAAALRCERDRLACELEALRSQHLAMQDSGSKSIRSANDEVVKLHAELLDAREEASCAARRAEKGFVDELSAARAEAKRAQGALDALVGEQASMAVRMDEAQARMRDARATAAAAAAEAAVRIEGALQEARTARAQAHAATDKATRLASERDQSKVRLMVLQETVDALERGEASNDARATHLGRLAAAEAELLRSNARLHDTQVQLERAVAEMARESALLKESRAAERQARAQIVELHEAAKLAAEEATAMAARISEERAARAEAEQQKDAAERRAADLDIARDTARSQIAAERERHAQALEHERDCSSATALALRSALLAMQGGGGGRTIAAPGSASCSANFKGDGAVESTSCALAAAGIGPGGEGAPLPAPLAPAEELDKSPLWEVREDLLAITTKLVAAIGRAARAPDAQADLEPAAALEHLGSLRELLLRHNSALGRELCVAGALRAETAQLRRRLANAEMASGRHLAERDMALRELTASIRREKERRAGMDGLEQQALRVSEERVAVLMSQLKQVNEVNIALESKVQELQETSDALDAEVKWHGTGSGGSSVKRALLRVELYEGTCAATSTDCEARVIGFLEERLGVRPDAEHDLVEAMHQLAGQRMGVERLADRLAAAERRADAASLKLSELREALRTATQEVSCLRAAAAELPALTASGGVSGAIRAQLLAAEESAHAARLHRAQSEARAAELAASQMDVLESRECMDEWRATLQAMAERAIDAARRAADGVAADRVRRADTEAERALATAEAARILLKRTATPGSGRIELGAEAAGATSSSSLTLSQQLAAERGGTARLREELRATQECSRIEVAELHQRVEVLLDAQRALRDRFEAQTECLRVTVAQADELRAQLLVANERPHQLQRRPSSATQRGSSSARSSSAKQQRRLPLTPLPTNLVRSTPVAKGPPKTGDAYSLDAASSQTGSSSPATGSSSSPATGNSSPRRQSRVLEALKEDHVVARLHAASLAHFKEQTLRMHVEMTLLAEAARAGEAQAVDLALQLTKARADCAALEAVRDAQARNADSELDELRTEARSLQDEVSASREAASTAEVALAAIESELEARRAQHLAQLFELRREREAELGRLSAAEAFTVAALTQEIASLEERASSASAAVGPRAVRFKLPVCDAATETDLGADSSVVDAPSAEVQRSMRQHEADVDQSASSPLQHEVAERNRALVDERRSLLRRVSEVSRKGRAEAARLTEALNQARAELSRRTVEEGEAQQLADLARAKQRALRAAEESLARASAQAAADKSERQQLERDLSGLRKEMAALESRASNATREARVKDSALRDARAALDSMRGTADKLDEERDRSRQRARGTAAELRRREQQLEQLREALRAREAEADARNALDAEALQKAIDEATEPMRRALKQKESAMRSLRARADSHTAEAKVAASRKEVHGAEQRLQDAEGRLASFKETILCVAKSLEEEADTEETSKADGKMDELHHIAALSSSILQISVSELGLPSPSKVHGAASATSALGAALDGDHLDDVRRLLLELARRRTGTVPQTLRVS